MKMLKVFAIAALASSATVAMAADEKIVTEEGVATFSTFKPVQVRAEVGTTGYGGAVSWSVNPYTAITLGYNGGDISWTDDLKVNGTKYDLDMDNKAAYINAEIRPFANAFYVAGGVAYLDNDYELKSSARPGDAGIRINGVTYSAATGSELTAKGQMEYKGFAPYLGLGFSPAITSRVGLFGELGAYYTGNPKASLTATGIANPTEVGDDTFEEAVAKQEDKLRNQSKYEFLPVAKLGLSVRF